MFGVSLMKPEVSVNVSRMRDADKNVPLPSYETAGAAGMDVRANFPVTERDEVLVIQPGERKLVPTGLILEVPVGYEIQVRPRSGLALKSGMTLANAPGTIDSDYRGELGVILINLGFEPFKIAHGDRIAQLVLAPVSRCAWNEVGRHSETPRGVGGFGSTGV